MVVSASGEFVSLGDFVQRGPHSGYSPWSLDHMTRGYVVTSATFVGYVRIRLSEPQDIPKPSVLSSIVLALAVMGLGQTRV